MIKAQISIGGAFGSVLEYRNPGFDSYLRCIVTSSKITIATTGMNEKLLTGMLSKKKTDQPAHLCRLIRIFAFLCLESLISLY